MQFKLGRLHIAIGKKARAVPGTMIVNLFGFSIIWGSTTSKTIVEEGYCGNPDIYTVVNKVAKTASFAPWKVYRIKDKGKHLKYKMWTGQNATAESIAKAMQIKAEAYEEDREHPLNKLIEKPNPWQGAREFTENSIGFKLLTGERVWHIVKLEMGADKGSPIRVYNLPPQHIQVEGDGTMLGIKAFHLMLGQPITIPADQVVFSRYWNPNYDTAGSQLRGLSPWRAGHKLMTISNSGLKRQAAMLENAGAAGLVYDKTAGGLTEDQALALKTKMNTEVLNPDNANGISVANGDMGYINFGLKGTEMELLAGMRLTRNRICSIVGVPPELIDPEHSSYNNKKEAKKELITGACFPELDSLRDDWNQVKMLFPDGDQLWVDHDPMVYPELQEDMAKLVGIAEKAWWMKPNEKRMMMYMDEDTDNPLMNEYWVPSGITPMGEYSGEPTEIDDALNQDDE